MKDHDWLLGVCDDLQSYADTHGMHAVAEAINKARETLLWEMDSADIESTVKCSVHSDVSQQPTPKAQVLKFPKSSTG